MTMDRIDQALNTPVGSVVVGAGTLGVSLASLIIDWATAIGACIGAICGAIIGIRGVYLMIIDIINKRKAKKNKLMRRKEDKINKLYNS